MLDRGQREPLVQRGDDRDLRAGQQLGQFVVADAVHELDLPGQPELADQPLGRAAGGGLADHDQAGRPVPSASLANARSSVVTPFIGESALATATIRPGTRGAGRGWNSRVSTPSGMTLHAVRAAPKSRQMSPAGGLGDGEDRAGPHPAGDPALHPDEGVPAPLGQPGQAAGRLPARSAGPR